nr:AP endonuclease [uncultured Pseudomonas sp.]
MRSNPVSISLSSYGADLVRQRGQASFIAMLAAAGVNRVELREELFASPPDCPQLSAAINASGMQCLYSSPLELWLDDGQLNPALPAKLQTARALGAVALKVSLGHYQQRCDLTALAAQLSADGPALLVENDQTAHGGRIEPMLQFLLRSESMSLPLGMTFDIGNWRWQGESAVQAAHELGRWVRYVHCKAVERQANGRLVAVPPRAADLLAWEEMFSEFSPAVVRAVEFPLVGDDLLAVTRAQVHNLARLALTAEVSHA